MNSPRNSKNTSTYTSLVYISCACLCVIHLQMNLRVKPLYRHCTVVYCVRVTIFFIRFAYLLLNIIVEWVQQFYFFSIYIYIHVIQYIFCEFSSRTVINVIIFISFGIFLCAEHYKMIHKFELLLGQSTLNGIF